VKIGILGAGSVGGTLGKRWSALGHEIKFGVRAPADAKIKELLTSAAKSTAGTVAEAAAFGEVVVLSVPWDAVDDALRQAGTGLDGKVLLDCIEPVSMGADLLAKGLLIGHHTSAGEQVAGRAPKARVVKALNTVGWPIMADPKFQGESAVMPYCGDDSAAKSVVSKLVGELGFEPLDAGPLANARLLEPFGMLWISLAFSGMGTNFAFTLRKR
jgi:8-hydroxy-5-deazaflavin:NADPH oxidoreductase